MLRTAFIFFFLLAWMTMPGCVKEELEKTKQEVDTYIQQLGQGTYSKFDLPEFSKEAIPYLLTFRNEEEFISNFPRNPISSYAFPECRLGIFVLWTIESIRAVANESPYLFMRFPSLNPILFNEANPAIGEHENHKNAAAAYQQWWNKNRRKQFDAIKRLDPLSSTGLRWN